MEVDTYTTREAAKILQLTERRVAQMLERGELEGSKTAGRWQIPQHAVHRLLPDRPARTEAKEAPQISDEARELRERVETLQRDLGRLEGRLELTEVAESTMREQLERERERADQERQRADTERQRVEVLETELREARRSWWQRMFSR